MSASPSVDVSRTGLTTPEVAERRARGLTNLPPADTGRSAARILASNVFTVFNGIVGGSAILVLVLGAWQDALFGFFVVANTTIGMVQELRARRTLARLAIVNAPWALVRREGGEIACAREDVVLGDLLVLRAGEQLSADALLVESRGLEVDESLLTGEADTIRADVGRQLLSGSTVAAGSGLARVNRVGADSYAARITAEARQFSLVDSELKRSIGRIVRWLSLAVLPVAAIVVNGQMQAAGGWSSALTSGAWREAGVASVASIVAMIPAGLVFMTSVALAVGAVKLARGGVLVRELAAVEGLARVDLLCLDKTGTLTEGAMTLDRVEEGVQLPRGWPQALASLAADPVVNATSQAIAAVYGGVGAVPDDAVAFASHHKWSAARWTTGESPGTWVLGGADVVLAGSASGTALADRAARLAASGERTLVLAHSSEPIPSAEDAHEPCLPSGLRAVAILVFRDRVRSDAADTIRYFTSQGVEICVLSGDDPQTVAAVSRDVGIPRGERALDARELPSDAAELADALRTSRIFGRVTPEQKRDMIIAFQSLGRTVGMVGDGVNDTLALKHADLGIAMGSGSPAARAVAHVVLLDGDLARLPRVVAEGRQIIANVERLAKLFLSKTVYAIVLAITFGLLLWPFPFLPRQLSVVDGLTIGLPALVLALLPNSQRYRPGFLRRALWFCVPSGLVVAGAVVGVVAYARMHAGLGPGEVHTLALLTLTLSALWVLAMLSRPFTWITASIVAGAYAGLVGAVAIPAARDFLQLGALTVDQLLPALAASGIAGLLLALAWFLTGRGRDRRPPLNRTPSMASPSTPVHVYEQIQSAKREVNTSA
jgi:cation-transporting P-type ATPase E